MTVLNAASSTSSLLSRRSALHKSGVIAIGAYASASLGCAARGFAGAAATRSRPFSGPRKLGTAGPMVSPLGVGCMGMSEFYGPIDSAEVRWTLEGAIERGVTLFDTADMYGRGGNEELLSSILAGRRDKLVLATKFGIVRDGANIHFDNRPAYVKAACEASLRRLKTDYIDILYAHRIDRRHPVEDMVGAMADLVRAGKVRAIGLSEAAPATIRAAHAIHPLAAVETEYSLLSRGAECEIIPTCRALGIAFVPYAPLSRGLLTGQAPSASQIEKDDFRKGLPRFQAGNYERNQALVARLRPIAERKGCTLAQLSLAWLLQQGDDVIPIPGVRSVRHLNDNLGAANVALADADLQEIEAAIPAGSAAGERYTDAELTTVGL